MMENMLIVDTRQLIVTKGDNNAFDDISLYPKGREFVSRDEVLGLVRGYVPFLGWVVIALQEVGWLKYLLLAVVFCISLTE
jgi:signal peptidase